MNQLQPDQVEVAITQVDADERLSVEEAELDEMWSFVNSKRNPRWLWHAIDCRSGQVLAGDVIDLFIAKYFTIKIVVKVSVNLTQ